MVSGCFSVYRQESNVSRLSQSPSLLVFGSGSKPQRERWAPVLSLALPHRKHNKISSSRFAFKKISSSTCGQVHNESRQPLIGKRGKETGPEKMTEIKPTSLWIVRKAYIRTIERLTLNKARKNWPCFTVKRTLKRKGKGKVTGIGSK